MNFFRTAVIASAAVIVFAANAQTHWPPDHSKANINGKEGMLVYPADEQHQPIEPRDCFVQLAPMEALDKRHTYPCGTWFLPPKPGLYRCWVELDGRVSGAQTLLRESADTPFQGTGFTVLHATVAAGYVAVPQTIPPGQTVRYLHLDQHGYGFSLRVSAATASKPAAMPPGRVFAAIHKADAEEAVALARPAQVEKGKTTEFRIAPPRDGADLLVMLRKPPGSPPQTDARLRVQSGSVTRDADVLYDAIGWIVAAWYGLPASAMTVSLNATGVTLQEFEVRLESGKVTTIRRDLSASK